VNDQELSDIGIAEFFNSLSKASSLEVLRLDLFLTNIAEQSMKILSLALGELKSLRELCLNLNHCRGLKDNGIQYLFNSNNQLYSLTKLKIYFSGLEITKKGIDSFAEFLKNMPCLQEIELQCEGINKNTLQEIAKAIECMNDLRQITFIFNGLYRMTPEFKAKLLNLGKPKKVEIYINQYYS